MPYPEMLVAPMRAELTQNGFTELKTAEETEDAIKNSKGTAIVVFNSVCGCAAGSARPGVLASLEGEKKPEKLFTVFAGQDMEATAKAREFTLPYPPSSPSVAIFKDGRVVDMLERHQIEGNPPQIIAQALQASYNKFC